MRSTGQDVAGSSILYLLSGFPTERRKAACDAEDRLVGEEGGTIVDYVDVASVRVVREAYVVPSEASPIRLNYSA